MSAVILETNDPIWELFIILFISIPMRQFNRRSSPDDVFRRQVLNMSFIRKSTNSNEILIANEIFLIYL